MIYRDNNSGVIYNLSFHLIIITISITILIFIIGLSGINLDNSFLLRIAYGINDNNTYMYKNTSHLIDYIPFFVEYPKDWNTEQGSVDEFDYLLLSNPQNNSYFQIFFNSGTSNIDDIIYYNNQEIQLHNKILNASKLWIALRFHTK